MTDEAKRCVQSCREWYVAFSSFGKSNESSVKELLATAELIESLSAELEVTGAIAALARKLEVERDQLKARLEHVECERDALLERLKGDCGICAHWKECRENNFELDRNYNSCWEWMGVKEESHD